MTPTPNRAARRRYSGVPRAEHMSAQSRRQMFAAAFDNWAASAATRRDWRMLLRLRREGKG